MLQRSSMIVASMLLPRKLKWVLEPPEPPPPPLVMPLHYYTVHCTISLAMLLNIFACIYNINITIYNYDPFNYMQTLIMSSSIVKALEFFTHEE